MLELKYLEMRNFKSIGGKIVKIDIQNNLSGLTIITGSNGVGKTTIISAIVYALYGKNSDIKGSGKASVSVNKLINDINNKEMEVRIGLSNNGVEYEIIRALKPNILEIWKDGQNLNKNSHLSLDQRFIEQEILNGISYSMFNKIVYLSAKASSTPFLYLTPLQRKEFIEQLLEVRVLFQVADKAKKKRNALKTELKSVEYLLETQDRNIQNLSDIIEKQIKERDEELKRLTNIEQIRDEKQKVLDGEYSDLEQKLFGLNLDQDTQIITLEDLQKKFKECGGIEKKNELIEQRDTLENGIRKLDMSEQDLKSKLQSIKDNHIHQEKIRENFKICGDCEKVDLVVGGTYDVEETKQRLIKLKSDMGKVSQYRIKYKTDLKKVKEAIERIIELESNVLKQKCIVEDQSRIITSIKKDMDSIKEKKELLNTMDNQKSSNIPEVDTTKLEEAKLEYSKSQKKFDDIQSKIDSYTDIYDVAISDEIKESLYDVYIPVLKKYISEFVERFTAYDFSSFSLDIDDSFNITFKKNFKESELFSLSEGQKGSINLAFTFAFQKLIELKGQINFLIIDEILDISFDGNRLNSILQVLKEMSENKNIIIISHNKDINMELFDNTIQVEMVNGFSEYKI